VYERGWPKGNMFGSGSAGEPYVRGIYNRGGGGGGSEEGMS